MGATDPRTHRRIDLLIERQEKILHLLVRFLEQSSNVARNENSWSRVAREMDKIREEAQELVKLENDDAEPHWCAVCGSGHLWQSPSLT